MRDIKDYAEKYVDEPFEETIVKIRKRMVIEQCNKYKHDHILEIGCGMNPFFLDFKDYKKMVIAEPGDAFADHAQEASDAQGAGVQIVRGFLEERTDAIKALGFDLDFIILSSVLNELDEPQKMLEAIHSICARDTVVHINVPNAYSLHRLLAKEMGLIEDVHEQSAQMVKMQRKTTFDDKQLKEAVEAAGFEVVDSGSYFLKLFTHAQMQKCMDAGIMDEQMIRGLEGMIRYMPQYGAGIYVNVRAKA